MKIKPATWIGPLLGLLLFSLAIWELHHELAAYRFNDIIDQIHAMPAVRVAIALVLTAVAYGVMTLYDLLALRYLKQTLSYAKIAMAAFVGASFSNNIGLSMLAGASVRYRLYANWGLSTFEITKVVFFCTLTLWLGFLGIGSVVFVLQPLALPVQIQLPAISIRLIGLLMGLPVLAFLAAGALLKTPLRLRDWELEVPTPQTRLMQLLVGAADWLLAGCVLAVLLPSVDALPLPLVLGMYLLAQLVGLASQVPGGLGVFETVFLLLIGDRVPTEPVLGALFAFRVIYYLLPLAVSTLLLGANEILLHRNSAKKLFGNYRRWSAPVVPPLLAATTFFAGAVLLLSGAIPALNHRLVLLKRIIPLPLMEASHFAGSTIGMGLLLLARGLQRRLNGAYWITLTLLVLGIGASLLKGLDYEEALFLFILLTALLPSRHFFYRETSLFNQPFTPAWMAAIAMVTISALWLGFFSYKHVEYRSELWWHFAFNDQAPRFLRASAGAAVVLLMFAVARLLRPASHQPATASDVEMERVARIVTTAAAPTANLAFLGDKSFLFSPENDAFIMYGIQGRSWVAMGDPVGPQRSWAELIWRFREQSDRFGSWALFYQVAPDGLPYYVDLGLTLTKLGEAARVPLDVFSLDGSHRKRLRYTKRKMEKEGLSMGVLSADQAMAQFEILQRISDAWLAEKQTREKRFSLGRFNRDYISRFDVAVVKKADTIVAFANLWPSAQGSELSVDLMRYDPAAAPDGVMDYLFTELMLWGREQGVAWFDLGMAPLSGLDDRSLAPLWNRLGGFLSRHGGHFYNFEGLRQYKDKFSPVWEPRYLASPGGLALPVILTHLVQLISGGLKGTLTK